MNLTEQIFAAGIVGAGGAGFPTHKKLVSGVKMLVVNAAECEPLLAADRFVMRRYSGDIVEALIAIGDSFDIKRIVIGTKKKYTREIEALQKSIDSRSAGIEICAVSSFYPAGDEQVLIYEISGQTVPPGGIPLDLGVVVINVTTVYNIAMALKGIPVTRRFVTVTGEVGSPVIADVPVGASISDCIAAAGGATADNFAIIKGGPMMGKLFPMQAQGNLSIGKADGGVLILDAGHTLVTRSEKTLEHMINQAKSVCIQCSYCTELCPRYLIGHKMRPNRVMRSLATGTCESDLKDALLCSECGVCEQFSCPMQLSPRRLNVYVKGLLREQGVKIDDKTVYAEQSAMREYRHIAQSRFISRLGLDKYPTHIDELVVWQPDRVRIPLKHGVGRPSEPCVKQGDCVKEGDIIASVSVSDLGCVVHASIDGRVKAVDTDFITIEREA